MWGHVAFDMLPGVGHTLCAHVALGLLPEAHKWCLGFCLSAGSLLCTRGAWTACLEPGHTTAHT